MAIYHSEHPFCPVTRIHFVTFFVLSIRSSSQIQSYRYVYIRTKNFHRKLRVASCVSVYSPVLCKYKWLIYKQTRQLIRETEQGNVTWNL